MNYENNAANTLTRQNEQQRMQVKSNHGGFLLFEQLDCMKRMLAKSKGHELSALYPELNPNPSPRYNLHLLNLLSENHILYAVHLLRRMQVGFCSLSMAVSARKRGIAAKAEGDARQWSWINSAIIKRFSRALKTKRKS